MSAEYCGYEDTTGAEPCRNPAGENGRCWIPTHQPHENDDVENPGRPSKYTDDRAADAVAAAREGKSKAGCARSAGVSHSTLEDWLDADHTYEDEDFRTAFRRARANGETELLEGGLYDDDVDSSMAKFLLASSFDYTKTERREVDADVSQTTTHELGAEEKDLALETIRQLQQQESE